MSNETKNGKLIYVAQLSPDASDSNPGTKDKPFKTINAAAQIAMPGDTVYVHEGTYRETIIPPRGGEEGSPITYMAAADEKVYVKGSDAYCGPYEPTGPANVYKIKLSEEAAVPFSTPLINKAGPDFSRMPDIIINYTLGQVFVDGVMLDETHLLNEVNSLPGTWMSKADTKEVIIHFPEDMADPCKHLVEISVRKAVFRPEKRGLGYIVIRGFNFTHAANQSLTNFWDDHGHPQQGMISCRSGHHWTIENNSITFSKSIGIDIGCEGRCATFEGEPRMLDGQLTPAIVGYHLIQNNIISDHGQCAICGLGHMGVQIKYNVLERNNSLGGTAWEEAAIKTHYNVDGLIEGNLIRGNYTTGIWLDNVFINVRITRNVIMSNEGPGIFCELGKGPCLIDNNIITHNTNGSLTGDGIYSHDASGYTVSNNLIGFNANFGVLSKIATDRWHSDYALPVKTVLDKPLGKADVECSNVKILNNIFVNNHQGVVSMPYPFEKASGNYSDNNFICGSGGVSLFTVNNSGSGIEAIEEAIKSVIPDSQPMKTYEPGFTLKLQEWQKLMNYDAGSVITRIDNTHWQPIHTGAGAWIQAKIRPDLDNIECSHVEGIDRDFFGNSYDKENIVPGPFQSMQKPGNYHWRLFPIERK